MKWSLKTCICITKTMPNVQNLTIWKEKKSKWSHKKAQSKFQNNLLTMDWRQNRRLNHRKSQNMPFYSTIWMVSIKEFSLKLHDKTNNSMKQITKVNPKNKLCCINMLISNWVYEHRNQLSQPHSHKRTAKEPEWEQHDG